MQNKLKKIDAQKAENKTKLKKFQERLESKTKQNKEILAKIKEEDKSLTSKQQIQLFAKKLFENAMKLIKEDFKKIEKDSKNRASIISVNLFYSFKTKYSIFSF